MNKKIGLGTVIWSTHHFLPHYMFCPFLSLSLQARCDDTQLEVSMAHHGHGVRRFDPSGKSLTLWGAPFLSPHIHGLEGPPSSYCCPRKLGTILNELGHHKVRFLNLIS